MKLRSMYDGFLPTTFYPKDIYASSDLVERVILSGELVLAGLYPPLGWQIWNSSILWQPIPLYTNFSEVSGVSWLGHWYLYYVISVLNRLTYPLKLIIFIAFIMIWLISFYSSKEHSQAATSPLHFTIFGVVVLASLHVFTSSPLALLVHCPPPPQSRSWFSTSSLSLGTPIFTTST